MKDWKGNSESCFVSNGCSNHSRGERAKHDYYATHPEAVEDLLRVEKFSKAILEPACGEGHISKKLIEHGYTVNSTDKYDYGYGIPNVDFLKRDMPINFDVITNPPYKYAGEFVEHTLDLIGQGRKAAMLLRIQFLESRGRYPLFQKYPPKRVYVFSKRIRCALNGDFEGTKSNAVCYAWFVWEKGFHGEPVIRWLI